MEESEDAMDEWRDLVMSPKGLFSGFASDHCFTKSVADAFSGGDGSLGGNYEKEVKSSMFEFEKKLEGDGRRLESSTVGGDSDVIKTGGSIAERRAAKFGFNAPKISTPRFRSSSPLPSPGARSPYLTIPPGISPTALLDSPILLPNSQLSPTTGTFASSNLDGDSQMLVSESPAEADMGCHGGSSSIFKPNTDRTPQACFRAVENQVSSTGDMSQSLIAHCGGRRLTSMHPPMDFEFPVQFPKEVALDNHDTGSPPDKNVSDGLTTNTNTLSQPCHSDSVACAQMQDTNEPSVEEDSGTHNSLDGDHKATYAQTGTLRTADDGYNWRKYGQKQVKGSEYPRSYYKCTHPNCQVKKKVERSHDGHITEIIYKGAHNHPKPQPCRKSAFGSSSAFGEISDVGDGSSCVKAEGGSVWRNIQPGCNNAKVGSDWRTDGLEMTSSTSVVTEVSDPRSTLQGKPMGVLDSAGTPEFSSTLASNEDDEEDAATEGSFSRGDDNDNESDSKRRKKDTCYIETTVGSRAVREPRIVVQIESEIDILDDGYRWRKYGQKVVKGNPNPRSYYKCTSAGCSVRKHVERASQNLKFVITTYEGKHNHEVPAARNSSQANSGNGSLSQTATNAQSALPLPRHPNLPKPEPHVQDFPSQFDRKMECSNDFLRPNFLRNFGGGNSPFYQMNLPTFPNARPYGPFLSSHHPAYPGGAVPGIPNLPIPLPMGFPRSSNVGIANYSNPGRPLSSVQPLLSEENNAKLLRPKQEQGDDDSCYDTGMRDIDPTNSSASSVYNHIVGSFPS